MLDFSFYAAHAKMEAMEANGMQSYLRDKHGVITEVCNDGDVSLRPVFCDTVNFLCLCSIDRPANQARFPSV